MTKIQKPNPDLPSRSDSFIRMLELEKKCKMQRIQQDSHSTTSSPPSTPPSSANANHPPFRVRRVSAHPPLSHQTQIMKAVRRSSGLPALSISIPPSPTQTLALQTDGLPDEPLPAKGEHTKTVTFSNPEEEDDLALSEESSICQSPSWEQYGQKKKKKPKKRETEEDKQGKEGKSHFSFRSRGNRLSKVPPTNVPGVKPLTATDRSRSAPELDIYHKPDKELFLSSDPALQERMPNHQIAPKGPAQQIKNKPKSKGFLSNFRMQHGNVAAVQKILDNSRMSIDDDPAVPTIQDPHLAGTDLSFTNPRQPPSIKSVVSNSRRSISSQEKRPPTARNSGSSHGRSQSLLSSTLNKLKGPSYLYYHPTEDANGAEVKRPSSSHEVSTVSDGAKEVPKEQPLERPKERSPVDAKLAHPAPEFTFPPKPRPTITDLEYDPSPRARQYRGHKAEPRDISSGYESTAPTKLNGRPLVEAPRAPNRDFVMAQVMAQEKQSRTERLSQQPRQYAERLQVTEHGVDRSGNQSQRLDRKRTSTCQTSAYAQPQVDDVLGEAKPTAGSSPISEAGQMNPNKEPADRLCATQSLTKEDDQISIGTHASTIRPPSQDRDIGSFEVNRSRHASSSPPILSTIGRAVTSDRFNEQVEAVLRETTADQDPASPETATPVSMQAPIPSERSADYFTFITESYAPPSLELRSPLGSKHPSPQILEESEDDEDDFFRNHPLGDRFRQVVATNEQTKDATNCATTTPANGLSRFAVDQRLKGSPAFSAHQPDSNIPDFERLGISPKAARILAGMETASTSTSHSHQTDPSRSASERSSSSTCDDGPPSPSSATTPDSSRPQSRKGVQPTEADGSQNNVADSIIPSDETISRRQYRPPSVDALAKPTTRSTSNEARCQNDNWSRTAMPAKLEQESPATFSRPDGLTSSPPLVATDASMIFANVPNEDLDGEDLSNKKPLRMALPPRAQSALELHSENPLPPVKHHPLYQRRATGGISSLSLPSSPPSELADDVPPRKSAIKASRNNSMNNQESSALISAGAAYLQEARKSAPAPPVPSPRGLRPHFAHKGSSGSVKSARSPDHRAEPLAKMLVECCNCKFFHDMPSRVYECMAKPDSVVEDKLLGVSATITTMVKCPWCAHGMTTQCCAGYAAVVYLKEKLHGK